MYTNQRAEIICFINIRSGFVIVPGKSEYNYVSFTVLWGSYSFPEVAPLMPSQQTRRDGRRSGLLAEGEWLSALRSFSPYSYSRAEADALMHPEVQRQV